MARTKPAAPIVSAENLRLEYATQLVFDSLSIGIEEGRRIGVVGRNGDGKSSLMGLLTGRITPQAGRVMPRGGVRIGELTQRDCLTGTDTVGQAVVGDMPEHEWASDPRIRDIIAGLISDLAWDCPVSSLSGGERRRVALAKLLIGEWDLLALDEPTNHLDIQGIAWLARHLKNRWPAKSGALLVITHDRWFLDEVCDHTWEVHDGIVEPFEGGYAAYVLQRVERDRIRAATEAKRQNLMRKELAWLRRGAPARTSKPKFRIEAANQLIADIPPVRNPIELKAMAISRLGKDVIDVEDVSFWYDDAAASTPILTDVTWRIAPGERSGILGANGSGKSTLLKLICGELTPRSGRVKRGKTVRLAVLDQQFSQLATIGDDLVRDVLKREKATFNVDGKDLTPAQLLERLGFAREHLSTRVRELSGGQKRRLQILLVLLSEPNVIALDEPTNDVDADMLAALEDLLDSWPGTLLVISHDRYLLERVTDQQYAVLGTRLRHLPGGIDEYLRLAAQEESAGYDHTLSAAGARPRAKSPEQSASEDGELSGAEAHAARKEINAIDRRLTKLSQQIARTHDAMAAHDQSDFAGIQEYVDKLRALEAEVDELEERWLELSEVLS